jgi:hypothetical protein
VIIYCHSITARLQYISDFIGTEINREPFQLTTDIEKFKQYTADKINYSDQRISENEFFLRPHSLLFEKNIQTRQTNCFEENGYKAFFKTGGDFPFDIFAASFYLLSRYEEYLPHKKDKYGRYAHENSLAYKEEFLQSPLVNFWIKDFKKGLKQKFPNLPIPNSQFQFFPTYDIDQAWSYLHKSWWRSWGGFLKSVVNGQWSTLKERREVLLHKTPDPFDCYDLMDELHKNYELKPTYFFHVAEGTGRYDKNISPADPAMQALIRQHAEKYMIGVHPSWQSGDKPSLISKEIQTLEQISRKKIQFSRQHYIRFTLPGTFRLLIRAGI